VPDAPNNPAARLHALLKALKGQNATTNLVNAWSVIFALQEEPGGRNHFTFLRRYGKFLALPGRARAALSAVPDLDFELYSRWVPKLNDALLASPFNSIVGGFFNIFQNSDLDYLQFCADGLSSKRPEKTVDAGALTDIVKDLEQLRRDTEAAAVEQELKTYILDELDDIKSAIQDYQIDGFESLERGVERAFGSLLLKTTQTATWKDHELWRRFCRVLSRLFVVISAANAAITLPHNIQTLLIECGAEQQEVAAPALNVESAPAQPTQNGGTSPTTPPPIVTDKV